MTENYPIKKSDLDNAGNQKKGDNQDRYKLDKPKSSVQKHLLWVVAVISFFSMLIILYANLFRFTETILVVTILLALISSVFISKSISMFLFPILWKSWHASPKDISIGNNEFKQKFNDKIIEKMQKDFNVSRKEAIALLFLDNKTEKKLRKYDFYYYLILIIIVLLNISIVFSSNSYNSFMSSSKSTFQIRNEFDDLSKENQNLFLSKLKSDNEHERIIALRVIGDRIINKSLNEIKELALKDTLNVRIAAIYALGRIGSDNEVIFLLNLYNSQDEAEIKIQIIKSLSNFGNKSLNALYQIYSNDQGSFIPVIIKSIKKIGGKESIEILIVIMNEKVQPFENAAAKAIETIIFEADTKLLKNIIDILPNPFKEQALKRYMFLTSKVPAK